MMTLASKRYRWFALSLLVIVPGLISLIFFGLKLGIDFTGGTAWEMEFQKPLDPGAIVPVLGPHGYADSVVQQVGQPNQHAYLIRMKELTEGSSVKKEIADDITKTIGPFTELQFSSVGGALSTEIRTRAIQAIVLASIGILLYIAYAFRNTK